MGYQLSWESRGVVARFDGDITIQDLNRAHMEFANDARFDACDYFIGDMTAITSCSGHPSDIEWVWALDYGARLSNARLRKAFVSRHPTVLGWVRTYLSLGHAIPTATYDTMEDARSALRCLPSPAPVAQSWYATTRG